MRRPIEDSDGPNLYAYVHNNPLYYTDPDGRFAFVAFAIPLTWAAIEAAIAAVTVEGVLAATASLALTIALKRESLIKMVFLSEILILQTIRGQINIQIRINIHGKKTQRGGGLA